MSGRSASASKPSMRLPVALLAAVLLSVLAGAQLFRWTEQATPTWQLWRNWQLGVLATGWVAATL